MSTDPLFNKLFWRSRRGMLELDLMLVPFLKECYVNLPKESQLQYQRLIECEDQEILAWLMEKETPLDKEISQIVKIICKHTRAPKTVD